MNRTISLLMITALGLSCSQAPPPQVASRPPTAQESVQETETPREEAGRRSGELPAEREGEIVEPSQREIEERILTLTAMVTELEVDVHGKKVVYDSLKEAAPETLPITAELQELLDNDPFISQLENRLQAAEEELKAARSRFDTDHRVTKAAQSARDVASDRVNEERARKVVEYQREQIERAKQDYREAAEQLQSLKKTLDEAKRELKERDARDAERRKRDGEPSVESRLQTLESEQTIGTLTALVTQLQKDMLRKKARYETLSEDPKSSGDERREARAEFVASQEQLVKLKDRLLEARIEEKHRATFRPRREARLKDLSPTKTQGVERRVNKLVELQEEEKKLSGQFDALTKKYEELERTKPADRLAIDAALNEWLGIGGQLSALREKTARMQVQMPGQNAPSKDGGVSEITQRETEEKILTLTAIVTELQVDVFGKKALYDAIKKDPNTAKKALREADKNYREAAEQLQTLKKTLAEARAEQQELDRRYAERLQQKESKPPAEPVR